MTDEQMKALAAFETARGKLGKVNGKNGSGAEATYSQAYQKLVSLGLAAQIRGKYRG